MEIRKNMLQERILIVGDWRWDIYEDAIANGFRANNWSVIPFRCCDYLKTGLLSKAQTKLKIGTYLDRLNENLFKVVNQELPQVLLLNRTDLIFPRTLSRIKKKYPRIMLIMYHNDNPFIGFRNRVKWRHYLNCISIADLTLVYRKSNIMDAKRFGAQNISLFPPYYISYIHHHAAAEEVNGNIDVLFIGHYEKDNRVAVLDYLVQNGISVKVYGTGWEKVAKKYPWLAAQEIRRVWGKEYSKLISSAKIALVFLSFLNRDVWTRRCFEIPACGTMMMAPRTYELENLFENGKEAVYFDTKEDLLDKVQYYLKNTSIRERIAKAGRSRCISDGHSEIDRTRELIELIRAKLNDL